MRKMLYFSLLFLLSISAHAEPFPTLKNYVVNGTVIANSLSALEVQKRFGKPTHTERLRNECAEVTYTYYYSPTITFRDETVVEIFFDNKKSAATFNNGDRC